MTENTTTKNVREVRNDSAEIIPRPHAFQKGDIKSAYWLQKITQNEDVEPEDLIAVINRNPLLSRTFLDFANSVRYGLKNLGTPITTMNRAILMLGTRRVRRIADEIVLSIETVQAALEEVDAPIK